jgi:hypothetical protein
MLKEKGRSSRGHREVESKTTKPNQWSFKNNYSDPTSRSPNSEPSTETDPKLSYKIGDKESTTRAL